MIYNVDFYSFTKISEDMGTIQNVSDYDVEMSNENTPDSGIIVHKDDKHTFSNTDIYLRCKDEGQIAKVRVVPFIVDAKGGGGSSGSGVVIDGTTYHVAENADVDDLIDEYFPD